MSEVVESFKPRWRIPSWAWLALVPAVLIGLNQWRKGGRQRIELVGAGPIHVVRSEDAPEGLRFYPKTRPHEALEESVARIEKGLLLQPAVYVFGLDLTGWESAEVSQEELQSIYGRLHRAADNAAVVPIVVGPWLPPSAPEGRRSAVAELRAWWRGGPCRTSPRGLCVDLTTASPGPADADHRAALTAAIERGVRRLNGLRATTQRGR